ncbi:MAG: DUF494 family protein [Bacillota bacterium]|jgi:uncharacterized protein Smg (DUF494 family)
MERIMQIINHVMKEILRHDNTICSKESLTRELLQLGYPLDDIDTAFQSLYAVPLFLADKQRRKPEIFEIKCLGIKKEQRIFSPEEQQKFSIGFQNEILRLANSELLNINETEQVLLEAMQMGTTEVGVKDLELILHKVIKEEERLLLILPYKADLTTLLFPN